MGSPNGGGGPEQIHGERITLAGGTIGTPAILLRSGIGPADDLPEHGIAPVMDLPGVGANLIDHASVIIPLTTRTVPPEDPPLGQVMAWCTAQASAEENDLQLALMMFGAQPSSALVVSLMRPRSRGVLRLANSDARCPPDIRLNLAAEAEDERRLVDGVRLLCALANSEVLAAQHTDVVRLGGRSLPAAEAFAALQVKEVAVEYINQTVRHYVHPVGTAHMGPASDADAVVDQYGRVRGIDGLRVVDASMMPNIPRANTNLTCIMIGERIAEWMRSE